MPDTADYILEHFGIPKRGVPIEDQIRAIAGEMESIESLGREIKLPGISRRLALLRRKVDGLQNALNELCKFPRRNEKAIIWTNAVRLALYMVVESIETDLHIQPQVIKKYEELKERQRGIEQMTAKQ